MGEKLDVIDTEEKGGEVEEIEEADLDALEYGDEDSEDGEVGEDGEGETESGEPAGEEAPHDADATPADAGALRAELEAERKKHAALLKKLSFGSDEEALAYAEGKPVEEIRDELHKRGETFLAWEKEDAEAIAKAYPDTAGKKLAATLTDPARFAELRGDAEMRKKMSAVEAYEFVNRDRLLGRSEAAGAMRTASKAHLQPAKGRSIAPSAVPKEAVRALRDAGFTNEEIQKYYL